MSVAEELSMTSPDDEVMGSRPASERADSTDLVERLRSATGSFTTSGIDELVHSCTMFRDCSYDFVEDVIADMRRVFFKPGQVVVEEGSDSPASVFFVHWGTLSFSRGGEACGEVDEGCSFGEAIILGVVPTWQYTIVAEDSCMVSELKGDDLSAVLAQHHQERAHFTNIISRFGLAAGSDYRIFRHCACLATCSDAFLMELDAAATHDIYFPTDVLATEGEEDDRLMLLARGEIGVEIAGRLVRHEEVPAVSVRLSYGEDFNLLRSSEQNSKTSLDDHGGLAASGVSEGGGAISSEEEESSEEDTLDSLQRRRKAVVVSNPQSEQSSISHRTHVKAFRLIACVAKAFIKVKTEDGAGDEKTVSIEASVLGEEMFLGLLPRRTTSLRARQLSKIRTIHRGVLLRLLERYPADEKILNGFFNLRTEEVFPQWDVENIPDLKDLGMSQEFFDFLREGLECRIVPADRTICSDEFMRNVHPPVPNRDTTTIRLNRGRAMVIPTSNKRGMGKAHGARRKSTSSLPRGWPLEPGAIINGDTQWKSEFIKSNEVCYVSVLHRGTVARALEQLPADREQYLARLAQSLYKKGSKKDQVAKILRERSIFAKTSPEFLNEIVKYGCIRVFMPGDRIIEQGTDGTSMFILWVGTANVVLEKLEELDDGAPSRTLTSVGSLTHGSVFGELVTLGVQSKRTASIIAGTVCCTWEVGHNVIMSILEHHPVERTNFLKLVEEHLGAQAAKSMLHHKLFAGFNQQVRTLIGVNCERKLYLPGDTICREGIVGDRLYIINLGIAAVQLARQSVMQVRSGAYFGFHSICMSKELDKEPYYVTVVAETMCQVLLVSRATYQHALTKYPEMREFARRLEEDERIRARRQRDAFAKMVHRRRKLKSFIEALRGSASGGEASTGNLVISTGSNSSALSLLASQRTRAEAAFQAWHQLAQRKAASRREEEDQLTMNAQRIEAWLCKRREQLAVVKPKMDMKRLVQGNLNRRGPLRSLKHHAFDQPTVSRWHDESYYSTLQDSVSPYMSPCPLWTRTPQSARQSRFLPPLVDNGMPLSTSSGFWPQAPVLPSSRETSIPSPAKPSSTGGPLPSGFWS